MDSRLVRALGGGFTGLLYGVGLFIENFENSVEASDFEEPLNPLGRVQDCHMTLLAPDRAPYGNELAQAGTVDVVHTRKIQNEVTLAVAQQTVHQIPQRQIKDPQTAG